MKKRDNKARTGLIKIFVTLILVATFIIGAGLSGQSAAGTMSVSAKNTKQWAKAYLKELKANKKYIDKSVKKLGKNENYAVSFADITGDGIPEMFYTYYSGKKYYPVFCKIASYDGQKVNYIRPQHFEGMLANDLIFNEKNDTVFIGKNKKRLFFKESSDTPDNESDIIIEYKYTKGYLKEIHRWNYELYDEDVYAAINNKEVGTKRIVAAELKVAKKAKKVLIGNLEFSSPALSGNNKQLSAKPHKAMSYKKAVKYLKKKI